jgi:hypothetical protein
LCSFPGLAVHWQNLFLRKQLALFQEHKVQPHRAHDSTRLIMVILGRMFSWRDALVNVKPDTFLRWHRTDSVSSGAGIPAGRQTVNPLSLWVT